MRKAGVALRLAARIGWLSLRTYRRPGRAIRALVRLRANHAPLWTTPTATLRWTSQKCVAVSGRYFFDLCLPGWPSRAFDLAIERELERWLPRGRPPALHTAVIAMTKRCALKCEHCFEWDALNHTDVVSSDDLRRIVRDVQQRGVAQLLLSGGEPLQRFDDVLSIARQAAGDSDVWIISSGLGLTAGRARQLRAAGLTGVLLSVDHWHAGEHDRFRGLPGSFHAAEQAARHAREAGLALGLSLCPTRAFVSAENLRRYGDMATSFGAQFIQILEPKAIGHYAGRDVALDPQQQRLLEQFCEQLNRDGRSSAPTARYLNWSARAFGCGGAGDRFVYIDTDGALHACPFCRTGGIQLRDRDFDAALSTLQSAGCPSQRREIGS